MGCKKIKEILFNLVGKNPVNEADSDFSNCSFNVGQLNLTEFDEAIGGYTPGQFIVIAGASFVRKTDFITSLMVDLAVNRTTPVVLFSLEMHSTQIVKKILMNTFDLDQAGQKIVGNVPNDETLGCFMNTQIYIDDTPAISLRSLRDKILDLSTSDDVRIVFIDNLQSINDYESYPDYVLHMIKNIADEAQVTIIALSRLKRPDQRYSPIFLIKENIASMDRILQYADTVAILERPLCYSYTIAQKLPDLATICFIKNQKRTDVSIDLSYDYRICRFSGCKLN